MKRQNICSELCLHSLKVRLVLLHHHSIEFVYGHTTISRKLRYSKRVKRALFVGEKSPELHFKLATVQSSLAVMAFFSSREEDVHQRNFEVAIYEEDFKQLCAWVLMKTDIETGGDLFGLWTDKHTAVIQFVVGPGQNCRRSSVSFYQDISYLENIGSQILINEGLCHIGEWHSYHQRGLARPSGGDENTVWNNMPAYNLKRFVIFIANLEQSRKDSYNVNIGCFLFELESVNGKEKQLPVLQGTFKILKNENPLNGKLARMRDEDAEHDKIEIKMKCLEMEISPERPPRVTYVTESYPSLRHKRPQLK